MQRVVPALLAGLVVFASSVSARIAAPPPILDRVANSSAVVVGKVTAIEKDTVKSKDGVEYKVAVVKVDSALLGAKDLTHVKVGYVPPRTPSRYPTVNLEVGTEGMFFLGKSGDLLVARQYYDVLLKKETGNFDKQVEEAKKLAAISADPMAALKAKEQGERYLAAALLIKRYRNPAVGEGKTEPIAAEESKLILEALAAEEDWNKFDPTQRLQVVNLFNLLGVTDKDGFARPANPKEVAAAAKSWIKEKGAKYRIQRYVRDGN